MLVLKRAADTDIGPFFPRTIKSNLISDLLIVDQLDAQN